MEHLCWAAVRGFGEEEALVEDVTVRRQPPQAHARAGAKGSEGNSAWDNRVRV